MCLRKYTLKKEKAFLAYRQHVCMCVLSHSVLSDSFSPMNCRPLGSSVHGILQASILEWVVIFFSRASSWPRGWTCIFCTADRLFTTAPLGKHRWHGESEWMMVFPGPIGVSESGRWSVQCRHFLSLRRDPSSLAFQPLCWVLKNWPLLIVRGYGFPPLPPSGRQEPLPSLHSNSCQKERQLSPRMRTLPLRPQSFPSTETTQSHLTVECLGSQRENLLEICRMVRHLSFWQEPDYVNQEVLCPDPLLLFSH